MDNNNVNPQPAAPVVAPPDGGSSNKMVLWFVIGLVVILALVGGIYLYLSRQQSADSQSQTAAEIPPPVIQTSPEDDFDAINIDDTIDAEFEVIDQDLQQL